MKISPQKPCVIFTCSVKIVTAVGTTQAKTVLKNRKHEAKVSLYKLHLYLYSLLWRITGNKGYESVAGQLEPDGGVSLM